MVKFSKELEAQLIPEWKDAFVNYWQLKKHVKKIKLSRKPKQPQEVDRDFGLSIFDPIRSVAKKVAGKFQKSANSTDIIQKKNTRDVEDGQGGEEEQEEEEHEVYENELVQLFSEEDEVNLFFEKLDEELDKVNRFYKSTEDEFLERGDALEKQLQMLLDLKQILADRHRKNSSSFRGTGGGGASPLSSWPSSARTSNFSEAPTELLETTTDASETDDVIAALERNGVNFVGAAARSKLNSNGKPKTTMRIDIPATTPTRMITAVTATLLEDLVNNPRKDGPAYFVYKKRIQYAEKMIRGAFVELYKGLGLLKTYSSLNMMAFAKILKKFDKVAKRQASTSYLKGVKKSHFISSDKVVRLMDEVESIFIKHFANNDSKKAMKFLKPQHNKESHTITFFVGLFTGSFVTLFTIYAILAHLAGIFNSNLEMGYMETVYPVFSIFTLLSLHLFMYGCNLYMWKGTRINHNFIFEFSSSTALKYRDAFLLCTTFMTAVVGAMIIHLLLRANNFSRSKVDAIPGALLLISFAVLVCPIDMFYRSTRFCFIRIMRNIFFSPLYQVLLVDLFMADQLTSQIPLLRHMETTACYLLARSFQTHRYDTCDSGRAYRELSYVISFLPYYWRAMQCARRWFDDSDKTNLANMGKYVSAMVAAGARIAYARQPHNHLWLCTVLVTSVVATMYQLYWDFVRDWGLLNPKSKNPWLRDQLVLKRKSIYYMSIALNVVLRVAWLETVIGFRAGKAEKKMLDFFMASLEVIRRGHWNFYRLENEQLTNAGKFRAVKEVPLPFRETDSD